MRFIALILCGVTAALCGCVPRFEAWRIDRGDEAYSLIIERNYDYSRPIFWQIDFNAAHPDSGTVIAISGMYYVGQAMLDYQHKPAPMEGDHRFLGLGRQGFEKFLIDCLANKPAKMLPEKEKNSHRGEFAFETAKGMVNVNLLFHHQDGSRYALYDIVGEIPFRVLTIVPAIH